MKTFDEIREGIGVKVLRKGKEVKPTPKIGVKKIVKGKEVTEISKDMSRAQQAAIAISKKEKGEKPKNEDAFTKKAVDGGKMKPPSKGRLDAIRKQKDAEKKAKDDAISRLRGDKTEGKRGFVIAAKNAKDKGEKTFTFAGKTYNCEDVLDENILKKVGSAVKKVASPVTNRLTRAGRAGIAQKKIDKHNTKVSQQDTIKKANDAGKSAFGLTRKSRAANAQKKLDKLAKKKAQQDTINKAKNLQRGVSAGMEYEDVDYKVDGRRVSFREKAKKLGYVKAEEGKKMDSAAMKRAMDAFKKRGGKIKKVAPGKAAGYHGKDDPGDGVQGMMDRGDTKGFNRKKKVGSMR